MTILVGILFLILGFVFPGVAIMMNSSLIWGLIAILFPSIMWSIKVKNRFTLALWFVWFVIAIAAMSNTFSLGWILGFLFVWWFANLLTGVIWKININVVNGEEDEN